MKQKILVVALVSTLHIGLFAVLTPEQKAFYDKISPGIATEFTKDLFEELLKAEAENDDTIAMRPFLYAIRMSTLPEIEKTSPTSAKNSEIAQNARAYLNIATNHYKTAKKQYAALAKSLRDDAFSKILTAQHADLLNTLSEENFKKLLFATNTIIHNIYNNLERSLLTIQDAARNKHLYSRPPLHPRNQKRLFPPQKMPPYSYFQKYSSCHQ